MNTFSLLHRALPVLFGGWAAVSLFAATARSQQTIEREIEFELVAVEGAKKYEVRISDPTGTIPPRVYILRDTHFSQEISLGKWKIEVRSFDKRGVAGRWNELDTIDIGFKAPAFTKPSADAKIPGNPRQPAEVAVEWDSFNPLARYHVTLSRDGQEKPVFDQTMSGKAVKAKLPLGKYQATIQSMTPANVTMDGQDPAPLIFYVWGGQLTKPVVPPTRSPSDKMWTWKPSRFAKTYDVVITQTADSDGKPVDANSTSKTITAAKPELKAPEDLPPGTYTIQTVAKAPYFDSSDAATSTLVIPPPKASDTAPSEKGASPEVAATSKRRPAGPRHDPVDFLQGTVGPVFWNYNFNSSSGQKFNLFAGTLTAISADVNRWFAKTPKSAWAAEIRGRQTNIYLFDGENGGVEGQDKITVADRRIALIARKRKIIDRVGLDAILGFGQHHYTYLVQSQLSSVITPVEGELFEIYFGGALDWQVKNGSHATFDLTFHPVGQSVGISADQTWQYTATLRYMRRLLTDRSYVSSVLENFRSRVNTRNLNAFEGEAETISTWYRFGLGLAIKL